jgi:hypothetical protein
MKSCVVSESVRGLWEAVEGFEGRDGTGSGRASEIKDRAGSKWRRANTLERGEPGVVAATVVYIAVLLGPVPGIAVVELEGAIAGTVP